LLFRGNIQEVHVAESNDEFPKFLMCMGCGRCGQAWGVLEHRAGNLNRARELFQQGVWAQPKGKDVALVWQVRPTPPAHSNHCHVSLSATV
jgi:hypothetical protein